MFNGQERIILSIVVIVYFVFLFGVSLYINNRKIKTYDDYNVAGRSVSLIPLILTFVGTAIGGATLLGYMTNGFSLGMGQQWLNIGGLIAGVLMASLLVKRIRLLGEKHNMVTIGDFTALRYGEGARIPTVISILVAYCAITGMQFVAIATILNLTVGINMTTGIVISWILLTLKTYFGGLKSVIWQDAIHGTIQTLGIFVLFFVVLFVAGDWTSMSQYANSFGESSNLSILGIAPSEVFIYLFTIGAYQFVRQDLWQRFWAAKDLKTTMYGYWGSVAVGFLIGGFVIAIGVFGRYGLRLENAEPTLIYYEVISYVFNFPLVIIMIVALLATVISCADSFFMAGSSSIINDIIKPRLREAEDSKLLRYSRYSVIIVSVFALVLALYIPELVNLWVTGTAMLVSGLLAPVMFGLFWKGATRTAGVLSMWLGLIIAVIWQVTGHPFGLHPVFIGLPLSILTLLITSFITKQNDEENYLSEAK
ncbi:sodium:solute symporter family protein [Virgibacillus sp. C22-A2]|uniref:Sodium:solute symporter family protein n=1 Tax=Virgibacillus tibetensis TaxID=3042313 RepID=A0ABU6KD71_9BACI|nr:sodium:solute symporter family protein [Virgibacillus sp. C22-A2]